MTAEELIIRYAAGERNFAGITLSTYDIEKGDFRGISLQGINLRGADLSEAPLHGVDLTDADLTGVILESASLEGAILRKAKLYSANLFCCCLVEADLTDAIMSRMNATCANFRGARLPSYGFERAILIEADFRNVSIPRYLICRGNNLIWDTTMPDGTIEKFPSLLNTGVNDASKEEERGLCLIPSAYILSLISGYFLPSIFS
ncbi:MAG: pentapeptide repeat-containing protein [Hydrococcus sp. SU_1_0]|nr:pentapeptide repeat-containing protein [Hydrococcus sp. SU_1_0]